MADGCSSRFLNSRVVQWGEARRRWLRRRRRKRSRVPLASVGAEVKTAAEGGAERRVGGSRRCRHGYCWEEWAGAGERLLEGGESASDERLIFLQEFSVFNVPSVFSETPCRRCVMVKCVCVCVRTTGQAEVLSHLSGLVFNGYRLHFVLAALLQRRGKQLGSWAQHSASRVTHTRLASSAAGAYRVPPWRSSVQRGGA